MSSENPSPDQVWDEMYDNMIVIDAPPIISLHPTPRPQHKRRQIPGPCRPIQEGIFRKRAHDAQMLRGESSQPRSTQHFIRQVYNDPQQGDPDFQSVRWTSVNNYIFLEGLYNNRPTPFWINIDDIQCASSEFKKVKKIVCIISKITPNGLGDMAVTLKDQTGQIDGTMHHKIFRIDEYRLAITVGAVVILRNVTVCRFARNYKVVNIVARNIVKVIGVNSMVAEYEPIEIPGVQMEDEEDVDIENMTVPDSDMED